MKRISLLFLLLCGCSPVMEANRPDPVDIRQFVIGENRAKILAALGSPLATNKEDGNSCELYKLYTRGPDGAGKGAIAAGEVVADVLTLGLTEIIFTPVEVGTKNTKHAVTFCYDKANALVSINEAESSTGD